MGLFGDLFSSKSTASTSTSSETIQPIVDVGGESAQAITITGDPQDLTVETLDDRVAEGALILADQTVERIIGFAADANEGASESFRRSINAQTESGQRAIEAVTLANKSTTQDLSDKILTGVVVIAGLIGAGMLLKRI